MNTRITDVSARPRPRSFPAIGIFLGLTLACGPASAQQVPGCVPAGTNLAGWWPADGHVFNVVNQRAGVIQGSVGFASGVVGEAFRFGGAGKVRVVEATSLDLSRTNRWTLTAWVKPATLDGSGSSVLYTEGNRVVSLAIQKGTGNLESSINGANLLTSTAGLTAGQWTHVALVLDRATRTLYVNGAPAGTATGAPATTADSTGSAIGGSTVDDPGALFDGDIDELTVHRRVLATEEIAAIAAAGSAGLCYAAGGALAWVFEPQSVDVPLSGSVTLLGLAMGSPRPTYQWSFQGIPLEGQDQPTLELKNVTTTDAGTYRLVATSGTQSLATEAKLTVPYCAETPAGLVAWWPADGNALEFTGNHSGAVWNGVRFAPGVVGEAFRFDGEDAYAVVPDSAALSPQAAADGELSLEAWVYLSALPLPDGATRENRRTVLAKGDPGRWEYALGITTTGVPEFIAYALGGEPSATVAAGQVLVDRWHHLAVTLKKGHFVRLYQDGQLMAETTTFAAEISDGAAPLYLGRRGDAQFFEGLLDEPAIYGRALTGEEISALFAGKTVGKCYGGGPIPVFAVQPSDASGYLLNAASFEGLALGTPRPVYQWLREGLPIVGATNATLALTNLSSADVGRYTLLASNAVGSTASRTATLALADFAAITEDFERGWDGWSANDYSIWQVGAPTSGPGQPHGGINCAATVLGGNYPDRRSARLVSPAFVVPGADQRPRLSFWHWWNCSYGDSGRVQISTDDGATWNHLSPAYGDNGSGYNYWSDGEWAEGRLDLTPYAGQRVRLGFLFVANDTQNWDDIGAGWYVDDLRIETGPVPELPLADGFEDPDAWLRWTADFGVWDIGSPTNGAVQPHGGLRCLATRFEGHYADRRMSRVASAPFVVPGADQRPRLSFWHWWNCSYGDSGRVQISTDDGATWNHLSPAYGDNGSGYNYWSDGEWTEGRLDLTPYAGQRVRLGFLFVANDTQNWDDIGAGWYVDDLRIETGPVPELPLADGFEDPDAWLRWTADFGVWDIGSPTNGAVQPHGGLRCLATRFEGHYADRRMSRVASAPFVVPGADQRPRLSFWHWWNCSYGDSGRVQISTDDGATWNHLSPAYGDNGSGYNYWSDGEWAEGRLDLTPYAGQRVRLGFLFVANDTQNWDDIGAGWYVDDLRIETGPVPELPLADGFEDPDAWLRWTADFGVWDIGSPTNGAVQPHGGLRCLATRFEGHYADRRMSRVASAPFVVPGADQRPRLSFWHWWNCSYGDSGRVQISTDDGATWNHLSPAYGDNGSGYNYWSDGDWTEGRLDLTPYAGRRVRLGFLFVANDTQNWDDIGAGWYVDDLTIETGPVPASPRVEGFEDLVARGVWTADFGVWEIGTPANGSTPPHSGTGCLATRLAGRYADRRLSRVVGAPFVVPGADQLPRLRFWHWWSFSYGDAGRVQISTDDGANWSNLGPAYGEDGSGVNFDSKGEWKRESMSLAAYAGQRVRLGLLFVSNDAQNWDDTGTGWYVDDLMIQTGNIGLAEIPSAVVDEKTPVSFQAIAVGANAGSILTFLLPWAPEGASIDPETGVLSWLPGERHGPGVYRIPVQVVDYGNEEANEMTTVVVTVNEVNEQPWLLPEVLVIEPGQHLRFALFAGDRDLPRNPLEFLMTGAPTGATLATNTGILEWSVPADAASATYRIEVALADHGTPNYATNNTVLLTVTPNAAHALGVRHLEGANFEFTIQDAAPGSDYILQRATAIVDPATWLFAEETMPRWTPTLRPHDYMDWSTWDEFVQARLQRTRWDDLARVTATRMPFVFVHTVPGVAARSASLFRLSRVAP